MANGYKKIGGGGRSGRLAVTQDSLWWGADHLLVVERDSVVHIEKLLGGLGRIRDVGIGTDGAVYLLLEHQAGGRIVKLVPAG